MKTCSGEDRSRAVPAGRSDPAPRDLPSAWDTWRVLLIEDNPGDAELVSAALEEMPADVRLDQVDRLEDALSRLAGAGADAVLLDLSLPDSSGVDGVERLRAAYPDLAIVVLTGAGHAASDALRAGAQDYLTKLELDARSLERALRYSIARQRHLVQDRELAVERAARRAAEAGAEDLERVNERLKAAVLEAGRAQEREADARADAELRRQELEAFFASMVDAVVVYGADTRVQLTNRAATELFGSNVRGLTPEELIERARLTTAEGCRMTTERLPGLRSLGGATVTGERVRVRDGERVALVSASPVGTGPARGAVSVYRDVTELDQADQALREADRRKSEFLAILSHELRNPLAPIRNSLYILDRAVPGGEQARRAQVVIDRQVRHVTRLVDDLLDITRISRGKIRLQRERLELNELARRCGEDQRPEFARNGVELEVVATEQPLHVYGDPTRVAQMIGNLLHNAAKFTPRGGRATVSVRRESSRFAAVCVRDTGEGFEPETASHLFEPFVQVERTLHRSRGGLGLGLALVKGLATLHEGSLTGHSDGPGTGAEFVLTLPLERRSTPRTDLSAHGTAHAVRRVLVIEDNVDAAESIKEALELNEHIVELARTGHEGVERARNFRPGVVLCDIGLPGMDGYEVAKVLRSDPALGAVPLVAISGYATTDDLGRSRRAGFDSHLAKPVDVEELERTISLIGRDERDS